MGKNPLLKTRGLRHLALYCIHLEACAQFYENILGMKIVWQPDADNIYLSSHDDNLALHRAPQSFAPSEFQFLDHLGFFLDSPESVDEWHAFLQQKNIMIHQAPKNHRDGTRSVYCKDPDGRIVQMIYYPKFAE